jgi:hypothetical protein
MSTVTIKVVDKTIKASPDPVRVNRNKQEKVDWICHDGRFEVDFGNRSPFEAPKYGGPKGAPKSSGPCRKNADKGIYKYSIKVWMSETGAPIVEDPGVDVWDDGGGDGKLGGAGTSSSSSEESSSSS